MALLGPVLEPPDFWNGVRTVSMTQDNWLDGGLAVVVPAYIEHRPIRLLQALKRVVPVIATSACGWVAGPV